MARLKPKVAKIDNLEDANLVLKEIGLLERELEAIDAEAHKKLSEIKGEAVKEGEPVRKRLANLSALLGAFAEYNKDDLFKDKKTVELTFGIFGYRKSTSITVRKTTVELLRKLNLVQYIRIKEEPDREAMASMEDEQLAQVDAVRKVKDDFFCEADKEEINKELLKEQIA
jgi:phage host-nuclease inhibitor protein Gam